MSMRHRLIVGWTASLALLVGGGAAIGLDTVSPWLQLLLVLAAMIPVAIAAPDYYGLREPDEPRH